MGVNLQGNKRSSVERTVEWVDTDASGHQHNSAIIRWVESAEAQLFRGLGLPDYFSVAPRVQQVINYRDRLWFGQQVTSTVEIGKVGRTSMTLNFEVYGHPHEGHPGGIAAQGTVTTVHLPATADAAQPWPEHIRAATSPELQLDSAGAGHPGP